MVHSRHHRDIEVGSMKEERRDQAMHHIVGQKRRKEAMTAEVWVAWDAT